MKNTLIVIFSLIIVVLAITPLVFGIKAEEAYRQVTEQLDTGDRIKLETGKYNKGFLESSGSSVATVMLDANGVKNKSGKKDELASFKINHLILHGPFPEIRQGNLRPAQAMIITTLDPSASTQHAISSLFPNGNLVTIKTWINLDGDSHSIISASPIKKQKNDKGELEWRGLTGEIKYDDNNKRLTTSLDLPLFAFTDNEGLEIRIKDLKFYSDLLQAGNTNLVVGDLEFSLDELVFLTLDQAGASRGFRIGDIDLSTASRIINRNYHTTVDLKTQDLVIRQKQYGPVIYDVSLKQLDIAALDRIRRELHAVQQSNLPQNQQRIIAGSKFLSLLPTLLKSSPVLDINQVSFHFDGEPFRLSATVNVNETQQFDAKQPLAFLTVLDTQADITIPRQILAALPRPRPRAISSDPNNQAQTTSAESAMERMESLARQGYFTIDDNFFRTRLTYKAGQLTLNGKPFNPIQINSAGADAGDSDNAQQTQSGN
jgi:uncharacterized protein YdgA (DUF945 family)